VGVSRAAELLFTGRLVQGDEAATMGLASQAPERGAVWSTAWGLAQGIAANAPAAVRMMKRSLYRHLDWRVRDAALDEAYAQADTLETRDAEEGMAALLDKRTPQFEGR
jgi:enoyl-CoA hydratase/carnithine racemase